MCSLLGPVPTHSTRGEGGRGREREGGREGGRGREVVDIAHERNTQYTCTVLYHRLQSVLQF